MIRAFRFPTLLLLLAIVATLLMTFAPIVSRVLQSLPAADSTATKAHPDHAAMQAAIAAATIDHADHARQRLAADAHAGHLSPAGSAASSPAGGEHAAHGEACDYCTMASRLLPWLALLLVLASLFYRQIPEVIRRAPALPSTHWPAHAARGPPLPP